MLLESNAKGFTYHLSVVWTSNVEDMYFSISSKLLQRLIALKMFDNP